MIEVTHISKEFVSPKKYPGLKGAIDLFPMRKCIRRQWMIYPFPSGMERLWDILEVMAPESPRPLR